MAQVRGNGVVVGGCAGDGGSGYLVMRTAVDTRGAARDTWQLTGSGPPRVADPRRCN